MNRRWSKIASYLPGRTDNEIKNVWNTHLKKEVAKKDANYNKKEAKEMSRSVSSSSPSSSTSSFMSSDVNEDISEGVVKEKDVPATNEPKEASSSSSISSYASNYFNLSSSTRVDNYTNVSMPKGEDFLLNFVEPFEVNNQSGNSDDRVIEIPLEVDIDFWDMLDSLDPLESNESQPHDQYFQASQSSNFGEGCDEKEIEYRKWLRYLENELGLEATSDGTAKDCVEVRN
ncbi:hypothetical protein U1Q18_000083 [Sarracenia purpurea var. burkii]